MSPRAGEGYVEMIATGLGGKTTDTGRAWLAVGGQPVATLRLFTLERAVLAFIPLILPAAFD
ncbi:hypothetical protein D3C84_1117070 [compost metagenome]